MTTKAVRVSSPAERLEAAIAAETAARDHLSALRERRLAGEDVTPGSSATPGTR